MSQKPLYIVGTPRTGSTLVCRLLNQTGLFSPELQEWFGKKQHTVENPLVRSGVLPRNSKVFPFQYKAWTGGFSLNVVTDAYPDVRLVEIYRQDLASQVASVMYSIATDIWNPLDNNLIEQYMESEVEHNKSDAMRRLHHHYHNRSLARQMLQSSHRPWITFEYEEIASDPIGVVHAILDWCGADHDVSFKYDISSAGVKMNHDGKKRLAEKIRQWENEENLDASASALHRSNTKDRNDPDLQAAQPDGLVRS